jgi:hypothetical protein
VNHRITYLPARHSKVPLHEIQVNLPTHPLRVNTDLVAAEVVEGEAVIINLGNGMYYTMDKVGAEVWQLIERGRTPGEIADDIALRYDVDRSLVLGHLEPLIGELLAEELVVVQSGDVPSGSPAESHERAAGQYAAPALVRYTDMREVLALDPPLPELGGRGTHR